MGLFTKKENTVTLKLHDGWEEDAKDVAKITAGGFFALALYAFVSSFFGGK